MCSLICYVLIQNLKSNTDNVDKKIKINKNHSVLHKIILSSLNYELMICFLSKTKTYII